MVKAKMQIPHSLPLSKRNNNSNDRIKLIYLIGKNSRLSLSSKYRAWQLTRSEVGTTRWYSRSPVTPVTIHWALRAVNLCSLAWHKDPLAIEISEAKEKQRGREIPAPCKRLALSVYPTAPKTSSPKLSVRLTNHRKRWRYLITTFHRLISPQTLKMKGKKLRVQQRAMIRIFRLTRWTLWILSSCQHRCSSLTNKPM